MKLISVHIQNFKCIRDSGEFRIDPAVTSLVGKNESGKTAILQALEKLNPLDNRDGSFDELEYPRSKLTEFRDLPKEAQSHALITKWKLEPADTEAVSKVLGKEAMKSTEITITKGYYDSVIWDFECDEVKGFSHLLTASELHEEEKTPLRAAGSIAAAMAELEAKQPATDPNVTDPRSPREQILLETLQELFPKERKTIWQAIVDVLSQRLPKMVYFSEYLRMPGQVSLNDLKTRKGAKDEPGSKVFAALLAMIGRTIDDLETIGEFERLQAELEAASNRLTKEIFRYWTQNRHLRVQFRFEQGMPNDPAPFGSGYVMRTRIENTRHGVTTSFDDRSAGFVWFFSFLVWFSQVRKHYGENLVILLDEPGLSLHAKAQADLLRYIDERLRDYQVIYTTHSPFMVDATRILRARTVEDIFIQSNDPAEQDQDIGTRVGDDVLSTDRDTLFPLQAALGYDITQSLFIGEHTLLVEGPAELLYLPWFSRKLATLKRAHLDPRWTLTPCGGIDKIPSFLSLFAGQRLHIATLTDFAEGSRKRVRQLRETDILQSGHVFSAEHYAAQAEADVEDIIGREMFFSIVNECYGLSGASALPQTKSSSAPMRVVKEVEDHFRAVATSGPEFDHYRPAEFLTQKGIPFNTPGIEGALDRFERLFSDLNALLPPLT